MPAKNTIKRYVENGYYHLYNRGVEKRIIFLDKQDYAVFLSYLKEYLLPKDDQDLRERLSDPTISARERDRIIKILHLNNFANELTLLAYCLMSNHFHFFVKQKNGKTIDIFMQSLCTRYTMYFNRKYKRVGSLFQAVYKAVLLTTEEQFLHLSRYIHSQALISHQPSSYMEYIGKKQIEWVKPQEILTFFSQTNPSLSYQAFVSQKEDFDILKGATIEK